MKSARNGMIGVGISLAGAILPALGSAQIVTAVPDSPRIVLSVVQSANPRAEFSATAGSYVAVVRVAEDLVVHVLYPKTPIDQSPIPADAGSISIPLGVERYALGGVYAVASDTPFNFSAVASGGKWNGNALILKASRDPDHAANRFFAKVVPVAARVASDQAIYRGAGTYAASSRIYGAASRIGGYSAVEIPSTLLPGWARGAYGWGGSEWNDWGHEICVHGPTSGSGTCGSSILIGNIDAMFPRERANAPSSSSSPPAPLHSRF
jgi:hypothetical protein